VEKNRLLLVSDEMTEDPETVDNAQQYNNDSYQASKANSSGRGFGIAKLKLKGCPKCKNGDVMLEKDQYGWYDYCIQCGYLHDLTGTGKLSQ